MKRKAWRCLKRLSFSMIYKTNDLNFRVTLDNEYEIEDPITEKLALYSIAHVRIS